MSYGFWGRILKVDLSNLSTDTIEVPEADVRKYLLGSGLAAKLLYYDHDPSVPPLHPDAPLLFMSGLFTGGMLPGTSKLCVCARSPLTGIWNEATVGGHWPAEFRRTGYDGIAFVGKTDKKTYMYLTPDGVGFRSADHLWGLDTYELEKAIRQEVDEKAKVATIGPAGENGVLISSILFDPPISRVAARAGIGAVMGSKNLKAVVVLGDPQKRIPVAHPEELKAQIKADSPDIRKNAAGLTDFGTSGGVVTVEAFGDLPIKNWQLGAWKEGAMKITGQTIQPKYLDKHYSCFACPIRCGKIYRHDEKGLYGHGPEYETLGMLGANVLNDSGELVMEGNEWCNRYGMDTISAGSVVGFAIECFEKGIITQKDTGGLKLDWDGESMLALIHMLGRGEKIGRTLGKGVRNAAEELGKGAEEFAVHTKGLEYPAHDPRGHVSMALNYATAVRGACHLEALTYFIDRGVPAPDLGYNEATDPHTSADKPPMVVKLQDYLSVFNPLGMCKFLFLARVGPKKIARWLELFCGWDIDMDEVMTTGERLFNIKRMYNVKLGISRKDDILPPRLFSGAKPDGSAKGVLADIGNMLHAYYGLRGWTPEGIPAAEKLEELGL